MLVVLLEVVKGIIVVMVVVMLVFVLDEFLKMVKVMLIVMVSVVVIRGLRVVTMMSMIRDTLMMGLSNLSCKLGMSQEVVYRCVRFGQNLSICQVFLQCLDIMNITRVVLAHVLLKCGSMILR